jgi:transposase
MAKKTKKAKKPLKPSGFKRLAVNKARERVLKVARRKGYITNQLATEIGQWQQAWYHLNAMAEDGLLKKEGFNLWRPR